jgi:uncharacterized protein YktB (UPF0637 family)
LAYFSPFNSEFSERFLSLKKTTAMLLPNKNARTKVKHEQHDCLFSQGQLRKVFQRISDLKKSLVVCLCLKSSSIASDNEAYVHYYIYKEKKSQGFLTTFLYYF